MYICMYVRIMRVYVFMYVYVRAYIYVCVLVCMYLGLGTVICTYEWQCNTVLSLSLRTRFFNYILFFNR